MKNLFFILLVLVIVPCNTQKQTTTQSQSKYTDFNLILVGKNSKDYYKTKEYFNFNDLTLAKQIEVTNEREVLEENSSNCKYSGNFWYKVSDASNEGWVYGSNVFVIQRDMDTPMHMLVDRQYTISAQDLYFGLAKDDSYPVSDEEGLTGCSNYYLPYFYEYNSSKIYPFYYDLKPEGYENDIPVFPDTKWMLMEKSESVTDQVTDIKISGSQVLVNIERKLQEGMGIITLTLEKEDDYLLVTKAVFSFR